MKKYTGFTLAEVLITLGIIGVVAAMTIPTLMSNTGKSEFKTAYKKMISVLNQAVTMSVAIDYLDFGDVVAGTENVDSIMKMFMNKMQIAKTETNDDSPEVTKMFGTDADANYTIFFADGMVISYPRTANHCMTSTIRTAANGCRAIIDINGAKNPNKLSNCQWNKEAGTGTDSTEDNAYAASDTACTEENAYIADQFSVAFKGQQVIPNGYAARYVLYEK